MIRDIGGKRISSIKEFKRTREIVPIITPLKLNFMKKKKKKKKILG